jgi:hypothetical protein
MADGKGEVDTRTLDEILAWREWSEREEIARIEVENGSLRDDEPAEDRHD